MSKHSKIFIPIIIALALWIVGWQYLDSSEMPQEVAVKEVSKVIDKPLFFQKEDVNIFFDSTNRKSLYDVTLTKEEVAHSHDIYEVLLTDIPECSGTSLHNRYVHILSNGSSFDHVILSVTRPLSDLPLEMQNLFDTLLSDEMCEYVDRSESNQEKIVTLKNAYRELYENEDVAKIQEVINDIDQLMD